MQLGAVEVGCVAVEVPVADVRYGVGEVTG